MQIKNILKNIYYGLNNVKFPQGVTFKLGFIFHTEEIFNPTIHDNLVRFCKEYTALTNSRCICVTMTPPNKRVEKGMKLFSCSNQEYINRMLELSELAHIGFHGHFWHDPKKFEDPDFEISKFNTAYKYEELFRQFEYQVNWFYENNLPHNNTYSGGWWFINKDIIELLGKHKFEYDYSMSKSPNLWNPFSIELVKQNNIMYGQSFYTEVLNNKLLHIQNLHCGQDTPFPQDATRFMNTLLEKNMKNVTGVLNSHDYCLDYEYTLKWIRYLAELPQVTFMNHSELVCQDIVNAAVISL